MDDVILRLDKLDRKVDRLDQKLDHGLEKLNDKIDAGNKALNDKIDAGVKALNDKIDMNHLELNRSFNKIYTLIFMFLTALIGGLLALLAKVIGVF